MNYMDIFCRYLDNKLELTTAKEKIEKTLPELLYSGRIKDYAKATLCITYFKRYQQYNAGVISAKDLLLFIRDFVLFMGRFKFPRLITDVVIKYGNELKVIVSPDGAIDVVDSYPSSLEKHKNFIRQVYSLGKDEFVKKKDAPGDNYLCQFSRFKEYRSLEQKLAVRSAIELPDNHTLLISLPTGGGKSLVTQLLAATEERLTLVVVPTVSLAKDQCLQANSCLIDENSKQKVFCYRSGSDNEKIITSVKNKTAKLIFTSPEAILKSEKFNQALRDAASTQYLHNVVIDEAHIVPDWGVYFRPDFQIFSVVLNELRLLSNNFIRTYLLSATLSDDVVKVLFDLFGTKDGNVEFRCDALRQEPRYVVIENNNYDIREREVIEMVKYLPKPLIVYVIEPATAKRYCKALYKLGYKNIYSYTGETVDKERDTILEAWKNNEFDIIFATSAFGIGVDKSNVRTVVHACVPENLSRFYQEVGRAGRDGLPSLSVMSYFVKRYDKRNDLTVAFGLVNGNVLRTKNIINRFKSILDDESTVINGDLVTADLNVVPRKDEAVHPGLKNMGWNANLLLLLHREGYIEIIEAKYDAKERSYLFTFKIRDIDLLKNDTHLITVIGVDRKKEYDMHVDGYHKMADLIHHPREKCWGQHFVSLYPYAQTVCSGCPVHPEGTTIQEDDIKIRKESIVHIEPSKPSLKLKRHMGIYKDLLVPLNEYNSVDINLIKEKANNLCLSCIVLPDIFKDRNMGNCLSLTHSEFIAIAEDISWLLRNGVMILLDDDNIMSNKIFEILQMKQFESYRKIWCCKPSTFIISRNRTINDFLDCRSCNLSSL